MTVALATLIFFTGIAGLLWLDKDPKSRSSPAQWLAFAWFFLAYSRSASRWLGLGSEESWTSSRLAEGSPFDRAVYTLLLIAAYVVLVNRREQVLKILKKSGPVLLFFAYCLVSLLWSDYPGVGFKRLNKSIGDLVMILIVWTDPQPIAALKRLLSRTAYTLIPLSVLFIKYYPNLGRVYGRWSGATYYTGVAVDKNTLGATCLLCGLGIVWRMLNRSKTVHFGIRGGRELMAQVASIAMILWIFSIADSMTAMLCFVIGSCVLLAASSPIFTRRRFLIHPFVAMMVLIPAAVAFLDVSPAALHSVGRNSSLTERTDIWAAVIKLTTNPWLGTGYENFWLGSRLDAMIANVTHWWIPNQCHNGYLEIWVNLGWVGIALLALVIFWGYLRVIQLWHHDAAFGSLILGFFIVGLVYNFTEAAFFRMIAPVWMFFLLAVTAPKLTMAPRSAEVQVMKAQIIGWRGLPVSRGWAE